jgi:hypothetical protein
MNIKVSRNMMFFKENDRDSQVYWGLVEFKFAGYGLTN